MFDELDEILAWLAFPTNPINALEASYLSTSEEGEFWEFPTNPINALEASEGW